MKDFELDFAPLAGIGRKQVTRRAFLAGAATATAASAFAANQTYDYRLVFLKDDSANTLTIRQDRRRVNNAQTENQSFDDWELGEGGSWTIPAAAFGPKAVFRLNQKGFDKPRYKLIVEKAEYGRNRGREIYFELTAGKFQPYAIAMWTEVWSLTVGPNKTETFSLGSRPAQKDRDLERKATPVLFSEFASGRRVSNLYQWVANGRIASTFQLIFNGLLNTRADDNQDGVFLSFSPDCVWRVADAEIEFETAGAPSVAITAFDGEVALNEFRFAWCRGLSARDTLNTLAETDEGDEGGTVLLGTGTPTVGAKEVVLTLDDRTLTLTHRAEETKKPPTQRRLWVTSGYPPEARPAPKQADGKSPVTTIGLSEAELALTGFWSLQLDSAAADTETTAPETFDITQVLSGVLRQRLALHRTAQGKLKPDQLKTETFFDADFVTDKSFRSQTPVGPLLVAGMPPEETSRSEETSASTNGEEEETETVFSAAGALRPRRGAAVRLVASRRAAGQPVRLRWFEANLHLQELFRPLGGTDFSRLTFAPTSLMVIFSEEDAPPSGYSSFVSLREVGGPRAQIDLDRARLVAGGAGGLVHLTFRFQRMAMALDAASATIAPLADVCRVTRLDPFEDDDLIAERPEHAVVVNRSYVEMPPPEPDASRRALRDDRAILVVEFPPQHVMEEAFFRLDPGSPQAMIFASDEDAEVALDNDIKVNLTRPQDVLAALQVPDAGNPADAALRKKRRETMLQHYRDKVPTPAPDPADGQAVSLAEARARFDLLEQEYRKAAEKLTGGPNWLPVDQTVYLGPYGLDADARGMMSRVWAGIVQAQAGKIADDMMKRAKRSAEEAFSAAEMRINNSKARPVDALIAEHQARFEGAQAIAVAVEGSQPEFQQFRTFYRETMIDLFLKQTDDELDGALKEEWTKLSKPGKDQIAPTALSAEETEFVWLLDDTGDDWPGADVVKRLKARLGFILDVYKLFMSGNDTLPDMAEARLARPSRLAFHVNCQDRQSLLRSRVPELGSVASDDPENPSNVADEKRRFGVHAIDFSLQDLTRWSGFEMSVTRRAQALTAPDLAGRVDALSRRQINDDGGAILDALGFPSGKHLSSAEWNAHLMDTLRNPPTALETAIEIPARLVLSPDQGAVFLAPQPLPKDLRPDTSMDKLWVARLHTEIGPAPIRAVYSPDLRPQVFARRHLEKTTQTPVPGLAPPPRGPHAPWLLDRYDGNTEPGGPWAFAQGYNVGEIGDVGQAENPNEALCTLLAAREAAGQDRLALPRLVEWLCARRARRQTAGQALNFRSALDAAIRHELVLLSSAHGMRVVARKNRQGQLLGDSQFLADERHWLYDLQDGSAIYKPQYIAVEEMELNSIGGSYRAMGSFEPPAGAMALDGSPLSPALSVERYQHWVVLGRDIFVEVLFKGFLLPFGHRASLVQVTERRYLRDPQGNITAYQVQRMYVQRGIKTVRFPGLGQPYQGRMLPFQNVSILSERSPDIVDPYSDEVAIPGNIGAGGRLALGKGMVGTVFWPRTAKSAQANVRFELELDDKFSTLPLLFVDNTAANDPDTLKFVVEEYYNKEVPNPHRENSAPGGSGRTRAIDPAVHLSTLQLGGGKLRYAEEEKAGSCSFDTESVCIFLTGQDSRGGRVAVQDGSTGTTPIKVAGSTFILDNHDFSPILQGADRIPAYPAMESARLYLRQNERLTGRRQELVRAGFDALYVMRGLPVVPNGPEGARKPVEGNLSEIFLSLIDMPSQDMGSKGDQAGGVMRPATDLVALSRLNGPVGVAGKDNKPPLSYFHASRQVFHHTANLFDAAILAPVPAPDGAQPAVADAQTGGLPVVASVKTSEFSKVVEDAKAIYENYFSDDSKLLGLISIRELVVMILQLNGDPDLLDPRTGMPKLNELIRYGGGRAQQAAADAVSQGPDAAAAGVDFVRAQIVEPLDETLVDVLEIWQETDTKIQLRQQKLGGLVTVVGLEQLLPGLNDALQNLRGAVQEALSETDDILFALSLGAAFEAGRRLIDTIGRILADVDEIVANAAGAQVRGIIDAFTPFFDGLEATLKVLAKKVLIEALTPMLGKPLAEELAEMIVDGGGDEVKIAAETARWLSELIIPKGNDDEPFAAFPAPPMGGLDWTDGAMASGQPMVEVVLECLVPTNGQIRDEVIKPFFQALMNKSTRDNALNDAKSNLTKAQIDRIQMVLNGFVATPKEICGDEITKDAKYEAAIMLRIATYMSFLENPQGATADLLNETTDRAVDVLFQMFRSEIDLVLTAQGHLHAAGRAVRAGNLLQAAQSIMAFVELFTGSLISAESIKEKWAEAVDQLTRYVKMPDTALCDLSHLNGNPYTTCTYDRATGIASEFVVVEPKFNEDFCTRVYGAHHVISEAKDKVDEANTAYDAFRNDPDIRKILNEAQATSGNVVKSEKIDEFLVASASAINRSSILLDNLKALTGETYCDLINDSMSVKALSDNFDKALSDLKTSGSLTEASRIPEKIEALMRSRQRLISALMVRLRATGTELRAFLSDEDVQNLVAGGAAGLLAKVTGVEKAAEKIALDGETLFDGLEAQFKELEESLDRFLFRLVIKLDSYLAIVIQINDDLVKLAGDGIGDINDLIHPFSLSERGNLSELEELKKYMTGLKKLIADLLNEKKLAGSDRVTIKEFENLSLSIGTKPVPLLEFVAPKMSGPDLKEDYVHVLRKLQADIESIADDLIDHARDKLRREMTAVLEKLDAPVRAVIGTDISFGGSSHTVVSGYQKIKEARDGFYTRLAANTASQALATRFLVPELGEVRENLGLTLPGTPPQDTDRLALDLIVLKLFVKDNAEPISDPENRAYLRAFLEEWGAQASTPHLIGSQVLDVIKSLLRGEVLTLIKLDQIRDKIEDRILEMVPSQITQSFAFKTKLPSGIEDLTGGIFIPGPRSKLKVGMKIDIDLFPDGVSGTVDGTAPAVKFNAFGALGAFDIKLVGQFLDALTLHFDGAQFTMSSGAQRRFDVQYRDFTIGRDLKFVADLAEMLNPGGSGPYVVPARGFPGIEAGYGLNIGTFMIGNMSIFNVSLNAAAILPFDNNPTRFRASLSRRDSPFTLSYAPYGGSGFFAIEADADGIVGFEASFEFGGAGAFAIGPLTGQGRIMAGFYIRQTKVGGRRMTELAATVFVGGAANLWIFSFGASLYVRLGMVNGNMTGLAIFTFSFSIGIKDFDFTVEWQKQEGQGFSGEQAAIADPQNPIRFAGGVGDGGSGTVTIGRDTVCQSENWRRYSRYFDDTLNQKGFIDGYFD